ncbi:long-chain fatty acid--CoA ligase [Sphingomonas sp. Root710]|uniref:long-chain fatty acid--CoA ligase n=1 Tax=Sphingomonas sp. Root710 TaxID=1736594 RepID=UPI0006F676C9|nr:long-chain fatty acid--CoA ligase [Sphingomonas sp. Root710]KRB82527.1 long-chain fatty acid--CoA ligase [Sphingomonas sp. Root710]
MLGAMQDWPLRLERLIDHAAREHGPREIVTRWADGSFERTNWAGIHRDARRLAQALVAFGIKPGDRFATLAANHGRHLVSWFGAIGAGAVIHTINPRLFDDQIVYIANHAEDRVLIYDQAFEAVVERLKPRFETIEHFVCFNPDSGEGGFEALIAGYDGDYVWPEGDERAPAMLCYTSGTTGNPKGVLYQHRSQMLHSFVQATPDVFSLSARAAVLPVTPLFHAGAWGLPFAAAMTGSKLVLSASNEPAVLHQLIIDEQVTHSCGVPTIWLSLLQYVERERLDLGRLHHISCGGSAAPRALIAGYMDRGVQFTHLWGMTELSPIGSVAALPAEWDNMDREAKLDLLQKQGYAAFGLELRVVDDEGNALPRDGKSSGQLQVRGAWVVERYFRAEKSAVDEDNWFDTGDIAVIHADGALQLTDRAKDVIKSGGEWISSVDLENAAIAAPCVAEAAAIGVYHPKWDERPLLLCVPKPGIEPSADRVREALASRVAKWWLPDEILFVDELPHTGTGKLLKTELRERYKDYKLPGV